MHSCSQPSPAPRRLRPLVFQNPRDKMPWHVFTIGPLQWRILIFEHFLPVIITWLPAVIHFVPNHDSRICGVCEHTTSTTLSWITGFLVTRNLSCTCLWHFTCWFRICLKRGGPKPWFICNNEGYKHTWRNGPPYARNEDCRTLFDCLPLFSRSCLLQSANGSWA